MNRPGVVCVIVFWNINRMVGNVGVVGRSYTKFVCCEIFRPVPDFFVVSLDVQHKFTSIINTCRA